VSWEQLLEYKDKVQTYFDSLPKALADVFAWISIVVLCLSNVPGYFALMSGVTDQTPPLDISLLVWIGLLLYFVRSVIIKDMINVLTIGIGFAIQVILLGLIFFL
jgi:hypothetical protein